MDSAADTIGTHRPQPTAQKTRSAPDPAVWSVPTPAEPGVPPSVHQVLALQSLAGNAAIATLMASTVQRQSTTTDRLTALEKKASVIAKQNEATSLDLLYRSQFGMVIADFEQVIYRLGAGFSAGLSKFTSTNNDQAQSDAVRAQLIGAIITVGMAAAFEPFLMPLLGKIRPSLAAAQEAIENPFNAVVSGAANTAATAAANSAVNKGQVANTGEAARSTTATGVVAAGDPLSFQSRNLGELSGKRGAIEAAFVTRSTTTAGWNDDQWLNFNRRTQESIYRSKLTDLRQYPTIAKLKSEDAIATIIEKLLWAQWVQQNAFSTPFMSDTRGQRALTLSLGGSREARIQALGISGPLGVTFHWYGNRPDDWQQKVLDWAGSYSEPLASG